jgi:hypothetical protein
MRFLKGLGILLLMLGAIAVAKDNKLGIHEVSQVKFDTAVHVGNAVLPAGEYTIRHTMAGEEHVMVFKRNGAKEEFKVKCTLVALEKRAPRDEAMYHVDASNGKVLQELVFAGDTAKHVF